MKISKYVFEVNTHSVITTYKIVSEMLRSMKDLFPAYEEYLASNNDIITNTKQQPEETISMIDTIQKN